MLKSVLSIRSIIVILAILFSFLYIAANSFSANVDIPEENLINILSGEMKTIQLKDTSDRIDIGTKGIVDIFLPDKKSLAIKGASPGFTTLLIRYASGTLEQYGVTVTEETPEYIKTLGEQLKKELEPIKGITIKAEGSKIVINGTIENETEAGYFKRIVSMYSDFVLDLTGTYVPEAEAEAEEERTDVVQIDVRVVQIRDTDDTKIGIKWFSKGAWEVTADYGIDLDIEKVRGKNKTRTWTDSYSYQKSRAKTKSYAEGHSAAWSHTDTDTITDTDSISSTLNRPHSWEKTIKYSGGISLDKVAFELIALAEEGKVKFLATPKLIVQSGKSASFVVGGEIPIAQSTGLVSTVEWKKYGTTLEINPQVLKDGRVFINLQANMSELDWDNKVGNYPALITKAAETNLTARDGETFAIAGLISQESTDTVYKVPLLGDIPILGHLFRRRDKKLVNTETIVFFTPHILKRNDLDAIKPTPEMSKAMTKAEKGKK